MTNLADMDPVAANAERKRRNHARFPPVNDNPTDEERRLGLNGAKQASGPELARLDRLAGARVSYHDLLVNLQKFETQCVLYPSANHIWQIYNGFYSRLQRTAEEVAQLSGETLFIPARITRPAPVFVAIEPGRAADAEPRTFKPGPLPGPDPFSLSLVKPETSDGPQPGPVPYGTQDGLHTPGRGQ